MPAFLVTYTTRSGHRREFTLEAQSPASARRALRRRGILPNTLLRKDPAVALAAKQGHQQVHRGQWFERNVSVRDKALFASKLSVLVDAGVPILRSLDLLRTQQKQAKFRRALTGMAQDVNQGDSLANAMGRWPEVFDGLSVAMVQAGEAGGVLDETLKRLARLLEEMARLQNQIRGALGYPITVLVIAILIFLGMAMFVIPSFATVYEQLDADLPWFTQMMLKLSNLLRSPFSLVLLGALLLLGFLFARYYATPAGRRQVDGWLLKTPLFGELLQKSATAQFCRTMSSLSRAGVPILMSLEIVRDTTSNRVIGDAISSSRSEVSEGIPLSTALSVKKVFPEMAVSMLEIGEETGEMDAMLSKVADFYEDEVGTTVKAMTSMLEPVMTVIVGLIVGSILLAMFLPMFSIYDKIR